MEIKRDFYLQQLVDSMWDGQAKVITGIRRCGKSFLLHKLFRNHLLEQGVPEENILTYRLDLAKDIRYRNPLRLAEEVRGKVEGNSGEFYLFIDEIQLSLKIPDPYNEGGQPITFYDALNDLLTLENLDIYVTGSNSKMLATDILTEFRGRGHEIRLHPLSFAEFYSAVGGDRNEAFDSYLFYGGLPLVISRKTEAAKMNYLKSLFSEVYVKDIVQRKEIQHPEILDPLIDIISSAVGSLSNPTTLYNSMVSTIHTKVAQNTVVEYIDHLKDAFLFSECRQFDIKGKSYLTQPLKYYCEDVGLRNARLGFRQQEVTHLTENLVYNELVLHGFSVDVGVIRQNERQKDGKVSNVSREVDFVATGGSNRKYYIQTAYMMPSTEKEQSERKPLLLLRDSFPKIIVRRDIVKHWYDDDGILHINLIDFLMGLDKL